jgi:hypothetical protein
MQRIRTLLNHELSLADLLNALQYAVAAQISERKYLQDEQLDRSHREGHGSSRTTPEPRAGAFPAALVCTEESVNTKRHGF